MTSDHRQLSANQQHRLISYLDETLENISGGFLRGISTNDQGYRSIDPLIKDMDGLVDVIWHSITSTATNLGQGYYLLRVADNMVDYIQGFSHISSPYAVLSLLDKLDTQLSQLVPGVGSVQFSQTDRVRLASIAERTRVGTLTAFEACGVASGLETELGNIYTKVYDQTNP